LEQLEVARAEVARMEAEISAAESRWARVVVERDDARAERDTAARQRDAAFAVLNSLGFSSRVVGIREGA
jgi:hypothetical protein